MAETGAQTSPPAPPVDEHVDLELADEQQILDELQGKKFEKDKFVYKLKMEGAGFQLTYKGVKLACREFAKQGEVIEVSGPAQVGYDPKDPEYLCVQVIANRVKIDPKSGTRILMESQIGAKRKWIKEEINGANGKIARPDKHFYEKAIAQAERNAKLALLPQDFVLKFIALILKNEVAPGQQGQPPRQQGQTQTDAQKKAAAAKAEAEKKAAAAKAAQGKAGKAAAAPAQGQAAAQPAKGAAAAADLEKRKLTMQQQLWAYFKSAFPALKTEDEQRAVLKRLVGKDKVRELDEALIKKIGPLLRGICQGENMVQEVNGTLVIINGPSSEVRWPEGFKMPEEPAPESPGAEEMAAQAGEEPLF